MRVLLSAYGSRGDVEPLVALAVRLRALGAGVRICAPPDQEFADHPWLAADPALARATTVAGAIRTDGATVAATLLLDVTSQERPPVPA